MRDPDGSSKLLRINLIDPVKIREENKAVKLLKGVFPPVVKYPHKYLHEWVETDNMMDPLRPLEPGEDWAGNVKQRRDCRTIRGKSYLFLHDYYTDGKMFIVVNKWGRECNSSGWQQ